MDISPEPTPTERCTLTREGRKRPLESAWESQLQQQFPDTMKEASKNGINIVEPVASNRVPYHLQKLRILSPNGRDLGEFNVELKSADPSKGNTITITKSNSKPIDKPLMLPPSSISHMRALPGLFKQGARKIPKENLTEALSCSESISWTDNSSVSYQQHSTILPMNKTLSNDQDTEGKMDKQTCNNNSINTSEAPSTNGINSKNSMCQIVDISNQKYLIHHRTGEIQMIRTYIHNTKIQETAAENDKLSTAAKSLLRKKMVELPCPANCKRPMINSSSKSNIPLSGKSLKVSKGKCIATIRNTENGKIVTSLKSAANLMQRYNQIDKNLNHSLSNNSRKNFNSDEISYDKNNLLQTKSHVVPKSQVPEIKTQNVMTIIPNNETLSFNQNAVLAQESDTLMASASKNIAYVTDHGIAKHDTKCDNTQSEISKTGSRNEHLVNIDGCVKRIPEPQLITDSGVNVQNKNLSQSNVQNENLSQSNVQNENLPQKDLSDRLDIIRKAMDSVKDNELRELALKALADCGIGIERYVPIHPPEGHKAVHDTQVQTIVFGLLDPKSFILINKDLETIHRLNQITLHDEPDNKNLLLTDNLHSNNNSVPKDLNIIDTNVIDTNVIDTNIIESNVIEQESPFDFDSFMEQFWKENSDTLKMKETLSITRVRCNSLLEHLQRDFECVKRYDQNGMLNIHNAVISDNVYFVRRQLMVLEHCKQSVDILTEDGATSLELAIKYDVCSEIVMLLLDAGAEPVLPRSIHESAVIIASKRSSPLLSMLVNRVSDSKLLDQIDSDGLAAIHYCSIHGHLQGVKTLISAGATVDLKDMKSGRTSLFHAIDNSHTLVMQVLLKAGAVANIANYAGQTALSVITDPKSMAYKMSLKKDTT